MIRRAWACILAMVPALLAAAQQRSPQAVNFYSIEKEAAAGREAAAALRGRLSLVHEPEVEARLARIAENLSKQLPCPFSYSVAVYRGVSGSGALSLAMPADAFEYGAVEPVAVAGGAIFVPLSLVSDAPNESVLAFQMAHAMAHIAMRHATRLATRVEMSGGQPAARLAFLGFARQLELEADGGAIRAISAAGYEAAQVVEYLRNLPPAGNEGMSTVYSAHPTTAERLESIRAAIATRAR